MKKSMSVLIILFFAIHFIYADEENAFPKLAEYKGQIYLYGEQHGVKKILDKEFELWDTYYKKGLRNLFLELPYYTAEYLNIWMQKNNNHILEEIYNDWKGTAFYNQYMFDFFIRIKKFCPETIFHGTDVGHQYHTTGKRFLNYLESKNLKNSQMYTRTQEIIKQGIAYYKERSPQNMIYRENMMVENFIHELMGVDNSDIMGIYGAAHTNLNSFDMTGNIPCMANQLNSLYENTITSEDLSMLAKEIEPLRVDEITVENKKYRAYYYGKQNLTGFKDFLYREFWRLDNAYNNLKNNTKTGDVLPYSNYIMNVELGQVYVVEYTKTDKTKMRLYYLSSGAVWNGQSVTENIIVK